jgi:LPXTG-motif cell wall-anchored protein
VTITTVDDASRPCGIYEEDVLGVLQNDPHYAFDGGFDLSLANIPQLRLFHNYLTASATVDGNPVTMVQVNGSENAEVPLTVVNTPGFDLPQTGDHGTWMYGVIGISMMAGALVVMMFAFKKKDEKQPAQQ